MGLLRRVLRRREPQRLLPAWDPAALTGPPAELRPECFGHYGYGSGRTGIDNYCDERWGRCSHGHHCWQELRRRLESDDPDDRMAAFNAELTRLRTEEDMDSLQAVLHLKARGRDMPLEEVFLANIDLGRQTRAAA